MVSKKQWVIISLFLGILFHFIFYFGQYGPPISFLQSTYIYLLAQLSSIIIIFLYFGTYWRLELKGKKILWLFDLLILWVFICLVRSLLDTRGFSDIKQIFFYNYTGLSLFPVLFFIVGVSVNYFYSVNRILLLYFMLATFVSLFFITYFELQLFLLFPIFYIIITIPLKSFWGRTIIILISALVIIVSLTNRAGILRILISFSIVAAYYLILNLRVGKKFLKVIVFCILMIPVISLYLGIQGQSVFQMVLGDDLEPYSQLDPYADTRTFLYFEVFQDLSLNKAFLFGKGISAGYASESFRTFNRPMVEVGFLQVLMKTGIVGFILYISVIISAIYKALSKSRSLFIKSLGLLLVGYILMFFLENIVAYNLLNIIIWIVVGMCHSEKFINLSDKEIKELYNNTFSEEPSV